MSRIEEALQRTGARHRHAVPDPDQHQHAFEPAWTVSRDEEPGPTLPGEGGPGRRLLDAPLAPKGAPDGLVRFSSAWRERLASEPDGDPQLIEQFRRLAGSLHQAQRTSGLRSVMITSAAPGDGKTLTAVNLALVLAESYRGRVLLIDADLRRPSIPSVIDVVEGAGLSEALRAPTEQKLALVHITPRLTLLPAGQPIANSIDALTSPRMRQIIDEAMTRFDWVILDAPPIGPAADAHLLTGMVQGTLFVVHAGQTQYPDIQRALDMLGRDQLLGVVLNGVEHAPKHGYYGLPRGSNTV